MQTEIEYTMLLSPEPGELIRWCRSRKQQLGLSNQRLAERSGVPVGTVDRILAGKYTEFRYSSIQPIVAVLSALPGDSPETEQPEGRYAPPETESEIRLIGELKAACKRLSAELAFLRAENERKHSTIAALQEHTRWLEGMVDELRRR